MCLSCSVLYVFKYRLCSTDGQRHGVPLLSDSPRGRTPPWPVRSRGRHTELPVSWDTSGLNLSCPRRHCFLKSNFVVNLADRPTGNCSTNRVHAPRGSLRPWPRLVRPLLPACRLTWPQQQHSRSHGQHRRTCGTSVPAVSPRTEDAFVSRLSTQKLRERDAPSHRSPRACGS